MGLGGGGDCFFRESKGHALSRATGHTTAGVLTRCGCYDHDKNCQCNAPMHQRGIRRVAGTLLTG